MINDYLGPNALEEHLKTPIQISIGYEYCKSSYGMMEHLFIKADCNMYTMKKMKKLMKVI